MKTVYRPDGRPALSPSASPRSACADGPVCLIVQSLSAPRRLCVCHRALLRLIAASCKAQLRPPAILFLHPSLVVCLLSCLAHALPFSQEARADVPWLHHRKFPVPVPDPSKSGTRKSPSYMNYHNAAKPSTAAPCPGRCRRCRRWQHAQKFHNRLARLLLDVVKCIHKHGLARYTTLGRLWPCRRRPSTRYPSCSTTTTTTSSTSSRPKNRYPGSLFRVPEKKDQGPYTRNHMLISSPSQPSHFPLPLWTFAP